MSSKTSRDLPKRAASKEARKQMHSIFGSRLENDDDDVIAIDDVQSPPKKKSKLSKKTDLDDVVLVEEGPFCPFEMVATAEPLSEIQLSRLNALKEEIQSMDKKVTEITLANNAEIIHLGEYTKALEVVENLQFGTDSTTSSIINMPPTSTPFVLQPNVTTTSPALGKTPAQSYQLVMDPRSGMIVGAVAPTSSVPMQYLTNTPGSNAVLNDPTRKKLRQVAKPMITTNSPMSGDSFVKELRGKNKKLTTQLISITKNAEPKRIKAIIPKSKLMVDAGKNKKTVDLTKEQTADTREVSFSKLQGTTYPSLVVVARPHLRVSNFPLDRAKLDVKVKNVLVSSPSKFTEWLIQQGLVKADQKCSVHPNRALKLGMYSDATKFPHSGGYVWISDCCPQRFVSVFSGSIFEGSQHPPSSILKLIYHWCVQTNVQNVTQWVKVDNLFVKNVYTYLRAICTVSLQGHYHMLGGYGCKVQIGVISLGTTSQEKNKREVKVEVLGILETNTKKLILKAVEPLVDGEKNNKQRFSRILEPVFDHVRPTSHIYTDLSVDVTTLNKMGFAYITQNASNDPNASNRMIMEYLRKIVPRMFQNTLALLSRNLIQQFLDELVWREHYGITAFESFNNILMHLSTQTKQNQNQSFIARLNKIALDPFRDWSKEPPAVSTPVAIQPSTSFKQDKARKSYSIEKPKKDEVVDTQSVPLENYYYGTIMLGTTKTKISVTIPCVLCKEVFNSNIKLMTHLIRHAIDVPEETNISVCRYCLNTFIDADDLQMHIDKKHPNESKFGGYYVCLICELEFKSPLLLGKHMSRVHCPAELPYPCGACSFRCSNHRQAIDHFYNTHDMGNMVQCPICLITTPIYSSGANAPPSTLSQFVQHITKHIHKKNVEKCSKCILVFISGEQMKFHFTRMHVSQRGKNGLVPVFQTRNVIMAPTSMIDKVPAKGSSINFQKLNMNIPKGSCCKECDKQIRVPAKHYSAYLTCPSNTCTYRTCCKVALNKHVATCINGSGPGQKLPHQMYCICGFKNKYGNEMAKHLALCKKKSAYSSKEDATNATISSMLDCLGLMRKNEESSRKRIKPNILKSKKSVKSLANKEEKDKSVAVKEELVTVEIEIAKDEPVDTVETEGGGLEDDSKEAKIEDGDKKITEEEDDASVVTEDVSVKDDEKSKGEDKDKEKDVVDKENDLDKETTDMKFSALLNSSENEEQIKENENEEIKENEVTKENESDVNEESKKTDENPTTSLNVEPGTIDNAKDDSNVNNPTDVIEDCEMSSKPETLDSVINEIEKACEENVQNNTDVEMEEKLDNCQTTFENSKINSTETPTPIEAMITEDASDVNNMMDVGDIPLPTDDFLN